MSYANVTPAQPLGNTVSYKRTGDPTFVLELILLHSFLIDNYLNHHLVKVDGEKGYRYI